MNININHNIKLWTKIHGVPQVKLDFVSFRKKKETNLERVKQGRVNNLNSISPRSREDKIHFIIHRILPSKSQRGGSVNA